MLLTEEEAKEKGCHLVIRGSSAGEHNAVKFLGRCPASQCMAWRWSCWKDHNTAPFSENCKGYCGLAGRVE